MIDIYRGGWQLTKVRGMMIFSAVCAAGALYWAWDLFNTVGLRPADGYGGVLAPLGVRLAWALSVAALGIAFAAGMWLFGRRYATRIRYDPRTDTLHIGTLQFLASRTEVHPVSDVCDAIYYHGEMEGSGVDAPWYTLQLRQRRRSLVLDAQGVFPDPALAARLLKLPGGTREAAQPATAATEEEPDFHHDDLAALSAGEGRARWRRQWLSSIARFADAKGQRRDWLESDDPHARYGFEDLRGLYVDDLNLREGGYDWAIGQGLVTQEEADAVAEFHALHAGYGGPPDDEDSSDESFVEDLLADPAWHEVQAGARRARSRLIELIKDEDEREALVAGSPG